MKIGYKKMLNFLLGWKQHNINYYSDRFIVLLLVDK